MCSTFSGDDPGDSTGMVTSRSTNALRSISDAYPIPATTEPTATAAVFFRTVAGAGMQRAYCQSPEDTDFHRRSVAHSLIITAVAAVVAVVGRAPAR